MLANLEALAALAASGTMTRAATALRVTQSAVSKRIAALGEELGVPVVERDGRRVRLTPAGKRLLDRTSPLLAELRHALTTESASPGGLLILGVSESILASWGPAVLASAAKAIPGLQLQVNAHRSPVAVERVRAGEYLLGLCAGSPPTGADLSAEPLLTEPLVLVPAGLEPLRLRAGRRVPVLTIDPGSATWRSLRPQLTQLRRQRQLDLQVEQTVQSFSCVVQMARAGFGHGLAPRGIARSLGVPVRSLVHLPGPGLGRPVQLIGRPAAFARPLIASFCEAVRDAVSRHAIDRDRPRRDSRRQR